MAAKDGGSPTYLDLLTSKCVMQSDSPFIISDNCTFSYHCQLHVKYYLYSFMLMTILLANFATKIFHPFYLAGIHTVTSECLQGPDSER